MAQETTPKYEQAYRVILDRLKSGRYPVGGRLPTEGELAQQFDVSRVTIRRALDMLVQDGYVESKQGSGYRVLTLSPASDTCLTPLLMRCYGQGGSHHRDFCPLIILTLGAAETAHLPEPMRTQQISRVVRLRLVDETAMMLVMTYAPTTLLEGATPQDFPETGPQQSILRILSARFGIDWSAACEDISPILADAEMAGVFDVAQGDPVLKQACSAFDDDGRVVFHEDVYRTGSVSFNLSQSARTPRYV